MATITVNAVESILKTAKKLDTIKRLSVANALLQNIPERLRKGIKLPLLSGLSERELHPLAKTSLSPTLNRRLKHLLKKNREGTLSHKDSSELDNLLAESDQIALLKAKALYTLKRIHER